MRKLAKPAFIILAFSLQASVSYGQTAHERKWIDSIAMEIDSAHKIPNLTHFDTAVVYVCFTEKPDPSYFVSLSTLYYGDLNCSALRKHVFESQQNFSPTFETNKCAFRTVSYYHHDQLIKVWVKTIDTLGQIEKSFYFSNNKLIGFMSRKNEQIDLKKAEKDFLISAKADLEVFKKEILKINFREVLNY